MRERMVPPWWIFALALVPVAMLAVAYGSALHWWVGAAMFVAASALVLVALWRTSPIVSVDDRGVLRVANACLPVHARGPSRSIPVSDVDTMLREDARAFTAVRSWYSRQAVVVEVVDPDDPHTCWIISVRDPDALVLALANG